MTSPRQVVTTTSSGDQGTSLSEYDNVSNCDNVRKPLAHVTYLKCHLSKYYEALRWNRQIDRVLVVLGGKKSW